MEIGKKIELLAELLDVEANEITPEKRFDEFEWNSITVLSFIVMMDDEFGKEMDGSVVKNFVTIQDALDVMEK